MCKEPKGRFVGKQGEGGLKKLKDEPVTRVKKEERNGGETLSHFLGNEQRTPRGRANLYVEGKRGRQGGRSVARTCKNPSPPGTGKWTRYEVLARSVHPAPTLPGCTLQRGTEKIIPEGETSHFLDCWENEQVKRGQKKKKTVLGESVAGARTSGTGSSRAGHRGGRGEKLIQVLYLRDILRGKNDKGRKDGNCC